MAQKVQVTLIDDTDGTEAVDTVSFGLDGVSYEIDLSEENAQALRDALAPYVANARRETGRRRSRTPRGGGAGGAGGRGRPVSDAGKIREWARANGYEVSERGRISADVREAYELANA
ncbi:Lsr2 family protein [Georgenia sp. TF02-10]|uniref:histone-like nucleoid-structuring protein Lsr2 n=1 Tax=Georgenia sp. TF02-10 TaxID=2917725 RepID=UPI001FA7E0DD|nr:Lsr2 family protein [Georgenia sp. TF02-10]UNX55266.1 Lsr2 family protein [Georgenia sp. TF02-10]